MMITPCWATSTILTLESSKVDSYEVDKSQGAASRRAREWWDEKVFNEYPTWEEAVEDRYGYFGEPTAKNRSRAVEKLDLWFGKATENGPSHYAKSGTYGIGATILAKMLNLNASEVEEALRNLPLTPRENQEDFNANFLVMLETWEAAVQFCASPLFFTMVKNPEENSQALDVAKFLSWMLEPIRTGSRQDGGALPEQALPAR